MGKKRKLYDFILIKISEINCMLFHLSIDLTTVLIHFPVVGLHVFKIGLQRQAAIQASANITPVALIDQSIIRLLRPLKC